jgi:hypothetical protein
MNGCLPAFCLQAALFGVPPVPPPLLSASLCSLDCHASHAAREEIEPPLPWQKKAGGPLGCCWDRKPPLPMLLQSQANARQGVLRFFPFANASLILTTTSLFA